MPDVCSVSDIVQLYVKYLGRIPDADAIRAHVEAARSVSEAEEVFSNCTERLSLLDVKRNLEHKLRNRDGLPKILLFGAFGNGNLGDRFMAQFLSDWIEKEGYGFCYGYSELNYLEYPFDMDRVISSKLRPLNPVLLESFDAMIIGGGGLLAYPHDPLWDPVWATLVTTRYSILGCGVLSPAPAATTVLVKRAVGIGTRDNASAAALRHARNDVLICPDPILGCYQPKKSWGPGTCSGRSFVLRGPVRAWHHKVRAWMEPKDRVLLFEAALDWQLMYLFPEARIVHSLDEVSDLFVQSTLVISERFHGAVLAALVGTPVIGVWQNDHNAAKIVEFFSSIKADNFCLEEPTVLPDASAFPTDLVAAAVADCRSLFAESANRVMTQLVGNVIHPH